jgi:class 3 adenylate cyclase
MAGRGRSVKSMKLEIRRFFDEFFLYSSQFSVFFIVMMLITPSADSFVPLVIVILFLIIQIFLLVGQGHKPILRILFSLITPVAYTLVRMIFTGRFVILDMANAFIWAAALYVGLFQAAALSARVTWARRTAEVFLAIGAVFVFVFFYFYLDLKLGLAKSLSSRAISQAQYTKALDIESFGPAFVKFIEVPQNDFLIFGIATFGILLLSSKVAALGLRARITALFGEARTKGKIAPSHVAASQEAMVTVISSDIRDFTGLAEKLSPEHSVALLNRYYTLWSMAADKNGGRIAGIAGDSVLVVFGLLGEKDAAERALACASEFIAQLPGLRNDLESASFPAPTEVSIGIHAGSIIAGDLGVSGAQRLGVFGEAISVASRLDSLCREFRQDLLLSQSVFRQLELESQARLVRIGDVLLRNSTQPVPVYGTK